MVITNWQFAAGANNAAWPILDSGGTALDAVEAAINHVELLTDEFYVGYGGSPNTLGETTLDAMIMWGPSHDAGAVGCLKRVKKAVSVARHVMERTQHTLLVGDDATRFAVEMGFVETSLTNGASLKAWTEWAVKNEKSDAWQPERRGGGQKPEGHDTVGSMAIDRQGNICVGCSTNGRTFKLPGRVGDSPIAGAGAYCDNDVGAAIATGDGDVMMRFLPTYHTVELMRQGASPEEAAREAIRRITGKGYNFDGAIVALNKNGQHGSVRIGWEGEEFGYGVQRGGESNQFSVEAM
ncbi:MAG: N(4)-(beta-N-acetylglucosaminyl)-L-asparaginase [Rhodothermia bacterium]|nr:N(4)-(beta-N-acetylglucosaminyl)-L-asparaginase [Rhodothermia bacterium]